MELQREPLKFHVKYLTHLLRAMVFTQIQNLKGSYWFTYVSTSAVLCANVKTMGRLGRVFQLIEAGWRMYASVKHISIDSDNGLSPGRHQAIIWTNVRILLIGPLGTNFSEIVIEIHISSFKKMLLKMSSEKWRPFCLGFNVLNERDFVLFEFRGFGRTSYIIQTLLAPVASFINMV